MIGILTNLLNSAENPERIYVNRHYVTSVTRAGAVPFLIPVSSDLDNVYHLIELADGLIFSGGQDLHPHYYGETAKPELGEVCLERDISEIAAFYRALTLKKPILGICRGMQLMNVCMGGSLIQDIPQALGTALSTAIEHRQKGKREEPTHAVLLEKASRLYQIFGQKEILTNSFHHQAVKKIAPAFVPVGYAPDGILEAMETKGSHLMWGVQWHPEAMSEAHPTMQNLFNAFVDEVT